MDTVLENQVGTVKASKKWLKEEMCRPPKCHIKIWHFSRGCHSSGRRRIANKVHGGKMIKLQERLDNLNIEVEA